MNPAIENAEVPIGESVQTFNKNAHRYAEKYFALADYDDYYARLLASLPQDASFIDVACGPGNVSAYVRKHRPDMSVLGVDLAPNMIEEARARVPGAQFEVCDCTRLESRGKTFDAAAFAFGLSYLKEAAAAQCLSSLHAVLNDGAALLLSTITRQEPGEKLDTSSAGDKMLTIYRTPEQVSLMVEAHGFRITFEQVIASPANASVATQDLVLIATRT